MTSFESAKEKSEEMNIYINLTKRDEEKSRDIRQAVKML